MDRQTIPDIICCRSHPLLALSVPQSRFWARVGAGPTVYVRLIYRYGNYTSQARGRRDVDRDCVRCEAALGLFGQVDGELARRADC